MQRLHAGDYPKFAEAGNVRNGNGLNVLNARPAVAGVIKLRSIFVSIKRGTHAIIADGVGEELQSAVIQLRDCGTINCRVPEKFALARRVVRVGFEHRRGIRFDDAVHHEFDGAGVKPIIMEFLVP
jgi:hypothetical protein